jgi:hypothetical protein
MRTTLARAATACGIVVSVVAIAPAPAGATTTVPAAPTAVVAYVGDGYASVSFTPPTNTGGSPILSYTVTSSPGGASCSPNASQDSCFVTGLSDGVDYSFSVIATNAIGSSSPSEDSNAITPSHWGDGSDITNAGAFDGVAVSCPHGNGCLVGGYVDTGTPEAAVLSNDNGNLYYRCLPGTLLNGATATLASNDYCSSTPTNSTVNAVACWSDDNCVAVGSYNDANGVSQSFVAVETNGSWADPVEVAGSLNLGGTSTNSGSSANEVACLTSGLCYAAGTYINAPTSSDTGDTEIWVDTKPVGGVFQAAKPDPGSLTLNTTATQNTDGASGDAEPLTLACPRAATGTCVLGGDFVDNNNAYQALVDTVTDATWATATELAGSASLNVGGTDETLGAQINAASCPVSGGCVVGGYVTDANGVLQALVAQQSGSAFGDSAIVPGATALNQTTSANEGDEVDDISCPGVGGCTLTGDYVNGAGEEVTMVDDESSGVWQQASALPAETSLPQQEAVYPNALACSAVGECTVVGEFTAPTTSGTAPWPFFAEEIDGVWHNAQVPALVAALDTGDNSSLNDVTCSADGSCTATGYVASASNAFGVVLTDAVAPSAPVSVRVVPANGQLTVTPTEADDGGSSVTQFNVTASPGGATCVVVPSVSPSCALTALKPFTPLTVTATVTTALGTSTASTDGVGPVYPASRPSFGVETSASVLSAGEQVSVLVVNAPVATTVTVGMSNGTTTTCRTSAAGQCLVHLTATSVGRDVVSASYAKRRSLTTTVYVPLVVVPTTAKHATTVKEVINDAPPKAAVIVTLSDGRTLHAVVGAAGTATVAIAVKVKGTLTVTTSVAGVTLAPAHHIKVT